MYSDCLLGLLLIICGSAIYRKYRTPRAGTGFDRREAIKHLGIALAVIGALVIINDLYSTRHVQDFAEMTRKRYKALPCITGQPCTDCHCIRDYLEAGAGQLLPADRFRDVARQGLEACYDCKDPYTNAAFTRRRLDSLAALSHASKSV